MFFMKKKIKALEEENAKLKETILAMAQQIRRCVDEIASIKSEIREERKREWTIAPDKKRKYN